MNKVIWGFWRAFKDQESNVLISIKHLQIIVTTNNYQRFVLQYSCFDLNACLFKIDNSQVITWQVRLCILRSIEIGFVRDPIAPNYSYLFHVTFLEFCLALMEISFYFLIF